MSCVYNLPNYTVAQANADPDSAAGYIFDDVPFALQVASPACRYNMGDFDHTFTMVSDLDGVGWAGIAYQPGEQFIVQGTGSTPVALHE
jgi:hypothetical protein